MSTENLPPEAYSILGVKLFHIVAGAAGGLARTLTRPKESIGRRITTTIIGAIVAGYASPAATVVILHYFGSLGLQEGDISGTAGFVLGVVGMSVTEGAIRLANKWRNDPKVPMP